MVSTRGVKARDLPYGFAEGLHALGYIEDDVGTGARRFRSTKHRLLYVHTVTSNFPGEQNMIAAQWYGSQQVKRIDADALLEVLRRQLVAIMSTSERGGYHTGSRA